jgi:hypothetical protein
MRNGLIFFAFLLFAFAACNSKPAEPKQKEQLSALGLFEKVWETDTLLRVPESVKYDAKANRIFVANINGNPSDKDANGFISELAADGSIKNLHFVDGLDAPKGMGILGNSLFVTNIDEIVEISLSEAKILNRFKVQNARFLNDIDVDETTKRVFVSDMAKSTIHLLQNGVLSVFWQDTALKNVNGLYFYNDHLLAGCASGVYKIQESGKATLFIEHLGGIDGLEWVRNEQFLVSDWSGAVHLIEPGKESTLIFDTSADNINAADIDFNHQTKTLYVPTFFDHRVMSYKIN